MSLFRFLLCKSCVIFNGCKIIDKKGTQVLHFLTQLFKKMYFNLTALALALL